MFVYAVRNQRDASTALSVTLHFGMVVYYRDASTALSVTLLFGWWFTTETLRLRSA